MTQLETYAQTLVVGSKAADGTQSAVARGTCHSLEKGKELGSLEEHSYAIALALDISIELDDCALHGESARRGIIGV